MASDGAGFLASFRVDPTLVPAPCFPPVSPASNTHSPAQFFDEATYTKNVKSEAMHKKKVKNSEVTTGQFCRAYMLI